MIKRQAIWWLSFVWLLCGLGVASYNMTEWVVELHNPLRNELRIGVAMVFIYTMPAVIITFVLSSQRFGLSTSQRRVGVITAAALLLLVAFSSASAAAPNKPLQATCEDARA